MLSLLLLVTLGATTTEVTVSSVTPTRMPTPTALEATGRDGVLIENNSQLPLWCGYATNGSGVPTVSVNHGHRVAPGERVALPSAPIWCLAEGASQQGCTLSTGDCTIVSEL